MNCRGKSGRSLAIGQRPVSSVRRGPFDPGRRRPARRQWRRVVRQQRSAGTPPRRSTIRSKAPRSPRRSTRTSTAGAGGNRPWAGTEAHDVPLALPAGGTYLVSFFRLGRERVPAGLLIVLRDLKPVIELETGARFVESAGAPGDADFRAGSSAAQPAERNEHEARAAAPRSRRGRRKAHR